VGTQVVRVTAQYAVSIDSFYWNVKTDKVPTHIHYYIYILCLRVVNRVLFDLFSQPRIIDIVPYVVSFGALKYYIYTSYRVQENKDCNNTMCVTKTRAGCRSPRASGGGGHYIIVIRRLGSPCSGRDL